MSWTIVLVAAIVLVLAVPVALGWWSLARMGFRYPDEERRAEDPSSRSASAASPQLLRHW